ncbi:MAG TPA: ABC transporter substrate-binding protein, partial [Pyrinomonadaceae bacterium]|nr:ABC transporter substrate-binding protein [Pyrinomonadaceae bacterium]
MTKTTPHAPILSVRNPQSAFRNRLACLLLTLFLLSAGCGRRGDSFVTALDANPATLDQLRGTDAASERLRQLMFNSLVRKNERFEYVGELAENIQTAPDGLSVTFTLRDGVTFHDGRPLTSADAKYTLDSLFASTKKKQSVFFETVKGAASRPYITGVEAPDPQTLVIRLREPWIQLLPN